MKNIFCRKPAAFGRRIALMLMAVSIAASLQAQQKFSTLAGVDMVSQNIWRGCYLAGASLQPSFTTSYGGAELLVWGSTDFTTPQQELDITLSYTLSAITVGITDYWHGSPDNLYRNGHQLEGSLGYSFKSIPVGIKWNTIFYGETPCHNYSSYLEVVYKLDLTSVKIDLTAGLTPWKNQQLNTKQLALNNLSAKAVKLCVSNSYVDASLSTTLAYNPNSNNMFWWAGLSLSLPK